MLNFLSTTYSKRLKIASIVLPKRSRALTFWYNFLIALFAFGIAIPNIIFINTNTNNNTLEIFEYIFVTFLIIDLILRLLVCDIEFKKEDYKYKALFKTIFSPLFLLDILIILPIFISIEWIFYLYFFKILRPMKATRLWFGMLLMRNSILEEKYILAFLGLIILVILMIFSTIIYGLENGATNSEILTMWDAIWYVFLTFSTIGFGDIVVVTEGGRIATICVSLFSITMLAITSGVIFYSFFNQLTKRRVYIGSRKHHSWKINNFKEKIRKKSQFEKDYEEIFK